MVDRIKAASDSAPKKSQGKPGSLGVQNKQVMSSNKKQKTVVNYPRMPSAINRPRKQTKVLILQTAPCLEIESRPHLQVTRN